MRKGVYIQYMHLKIKEEDWHAVSDAANDLRELEILIKVSQESTDKISGS